MLTGNHSTNFDHMMERVVGLQRSTCAGFEDEAYGACISLVYFRAFPLDIRNNLHFTFIKKGGMQGYKTAGLGGNPGQRLAFYRRLLELRQGAFQFASFAAVTDPTIAMPYRPDSLVDFPWSLSDSEFFDGMVLLRYDKMPEVGSQADSAAASAGGSIIKDELLDYVSKFLQKSADVLRPVARGTVRVLGRASFVSALVGALGEIAGGQRLTRVKQQFQLDEPRRIFLKSVGWGHYVPPSAVTPPTMPNY